MGRPPNTSLERIDPTDISLIRVRSKSHTPPILLTFGIFNKNLHNYLVDSGASSNILPRIICVKLNVQPQKYVVCIVQLDLHFSFFIRLLLEHPFSTNGFPSGRKLRQISSLIFVQRCHFINHGLFP